MALPQEHIQLTSISHYVTLNEAKKGITHISLRKESADRSEASPMHG
jgi:hypothetical protein